MQLLCNAGLIDGLPLLLQGLLDALDLVSLHVASADQHALQRPQAKVVVGLAGQLLVTQPTYTYM